MQLLSLFIIAQGTKFFQDRTTLAQHFHNMLNYNVPTSSENKNDAWWYHLRPRLTIFYLLVALCLLALSALGHQRLLNEVGKTFGGFFWAVDTDSGGNVVVASTPLQLPPFSVKADSLTTTTQIIAINNSKGAASFPKVYKKTAPNVSVTYTIRLNGHPPTSIQRPTAIFTLDMWWQNYGLGLLAGISWLVVGAIVLMTATEWSGAVEGLTLLPPAMLLLLYSHWGNVQTLYQPDLVFQFLWVPSFALLGAAFIHLSLTYRPSLLHTARTPRMTIDVLPYLPLLALLAYEWSSYLLFGHISTRINLLISLGYAAIGGLISLGIGLTSLIQIGRLLPRRYMQKQETTQELIPSRVRQRIGDLLTLWIGGVGLGFCLGVLPILLVGQTLLPLPMFYILAGVYPLLLLYAIRSLRLMDQLHITLEQREEALREQQRTATELRRTNTELEQATSLLLHADAHLRSILSQRIHDQPKQQALRIRSLLGHWQHKLRVEAERDSEGKVGVQPIIEALGKVRKISEELEGDLRGIQLLVEDVYQRRSLGLKLHLEKLIREDLPGLHPESPLKVQADLWALDVLNPGLEENDAGEKIAEAISYTVTQALLNIYNHAGATYATVRTIDTITALEVYISDDGRGFDPERISPEKTSLFKAKLKAREAGGQLTLKSVPRPQPGHGTIVILRIPLSSSKMEDVAQALLEPGTPEPFV
jgi:signal transduction histidine kinase